ncbi:AsmA family protein [Chitinimonas sp. PSY-7]|uniref:AsmA family protein n=1 Tax=Chitinimonas sp. PSY-7 TaxID=3459088 RepID=UPI0040403961
MPLHQLPRGLRRLFYTVVAILALVAAIPLVDLTTLRQHLAAEASESLGRHVQIGALRLSLLPSPNVTLEGVAMSEQDGRSLFAQFSSARFSLGWNSLLQGRAEVVDARVEGLRLAVFPLADGRLNCDDLLAERPKKSRIDWHPTRIDLVGAALDWRDNDRITRFTKLDLHALDPEGETGAVTVLGNVAAPEWGGGLRIDSGLRLDRNKLTARLKGFKLGINVETQEWHDGRFALNGDLNLAGLPWRSVLANATAQASMQHGDQRWQAGFKTPELRLGEAGMSTGQLEAEFGIKSSSRELAGQLKVEKLAAETRGTLLADAARVRLQLLDDHQNAQLDFESPLRIEGWSKLVLQGFELTGAYRNKALPRGAIKLELGGRAALDLERERFDWESRGQLDDAPVTAQFSLEDFVSPKYAFGFDLARLDLTPYLPVADSEPLLDPAQQLDWRWLERLNARGDIRLGELDIGRYRVFNLQAHLEAAKKKLVLEPLAADIYGGQLKGKLLLDVSKTPHLQLTQTLAGMEIAALLSDAVGLERLSGHGNLNVDVNTSAQSLNDMRQGLSGRVDLTLTRGTVSGLDLGDMLRDLRSNLAKLTGDILPADTTRRTRFSDLSARFVLKDGIAESRDLQVRAPYFKLSGTGHVDLGRGEVDYQMNAVVAGGTGVPELDALRGVNIPIQLTGPLASPTYRIDTSALRDKLVSPPNAPATGTKATSTKPR